MHIKDHCHIELDIGDKRTDAEVHFTAERLITGTFKVEVTSIIIGHGAEFPYDYYRDIPQDELAELTRKLEFQCLHDHLSQHRSEGEVLPDVAV